MSSAPVDVPAILIDCWSTWATRLAGLEPDQWAVPTRCEGWDVRALTAHVAPDPRILAALPDLVLAHDAAVGDAAVLLRGFNQPVVGVAHTMAPMVAQAAITRAATTDVRELVERFTASIEVVTAARLDPEATVPHPVVGSVTVAVLTEVALLEATVHLLDLVAAVGGGPPPDAALERVRDLLVRIADPIALVEAATGRRSPGDALPVIR